MGETINLKTTEELANEAANADLKIKIGTLDEVFWTGIKERSEREITICQNEIKLHSEILKIAKEKIQEEQAKP